MFVIHKASFHNVKQIVTCFIFNSISYFLRVQLLKVLETRKSVLQKEQGMAFARAVAAGFDIDHLPALMSFAECFGASRLM
jgi:hypothetical protein